MKKYLIGLVAFAFMFLPMLVNAETITKAKTPEYNAEDDLFVANGTPIVIEEKEDGSTYATWEGGEQKLTEWTLVIGGYYNPYNDDSSVSGIDIASTSITMNSGKVWIIVGGNVVDTEGSYDKYETIHVGDINVEINGGSVSEVSGVTGANQITNTALSENYYDKIESYYYADNVDITVKDTSITYRLYITSSYTYAKKATVTFIDASIGSIDVNDNKSGKPVGHHSISAGTNGKVGEFIVNITNSDVDQVDIGFRTMVDSMEVNIDGTSTIGDIYAGSYYGSLTNSKADAWQNLGNISYGQVYKLEFNIGEGVKYNNIYAGFQFASLDGISEYDTFYSKFTDKIAAGLGESVKKAPVVINTAVAPSVTDSELESMFDTKFSNVKVNYITTPEIPTVDPSEEVDEPIFGIVDTEGVDAVLGESIENNEKVNEALNNGQNVTSSVEITTTKEPSKEEVTLITDTLAKKAEDAKIVGYYDISVLLKADGVEIDRLTTLSNPIALTIVLPTELQEVAEGYTRTYYVVRVHAGKAELLETTLSEDGKSLTFETDKFSTYALTYVDSLASEETPTTPETPEVPQTFDSLVTYIGVGVVSIAAIIGTVIYIKRKQTN